MINAIYNDMSIVSHISTLLSDGGPSAIVSGVSIVVIYTIQLMLRRRRFAHIGVKLLKRVPCRADCDPSTSVVFSLFISRIQAAGAHVAPAAIYQRSTHFMSGIGCNHWGKLLTTTRLSVTTGEFQAGHNGQAIASAPAEPIVNTAAWTHIFQPGIGNYMQIMKRPSDKICNSWRILCGPT